MSGHFYHTKYLIVGAGITGLSTAYHLGGNYIIIEALNCVGGMAATLDYKGFKLDNAVHVLYFRHNEILDWIRNTLKVGLIQKQRKSVIIINNSHVNFPLQYHLSELPSVQRFRSVLSISKTLLTSLKKSTGNFQDYSLNVFGAYLTNIFMKPYNEKLFGVELSRMNTDWLGDYVPKYSKHKMILSAFIRSNRNPGRNSVYYYPVDGGIAKLAEGIRSKLNSQPLYNKTLINLAVQKKTAYFSDNLEIRYDHLISTIPLHLLLNIIEDPPQKLKEYSLKLAYNPITLLHILMKGYVNHNYDWIYFPETEIPFYRITFPGNINPVNCPSGYASATLEMGGEIKRNHHTEIECINLLQKAGLINKDISELEFIWKLIPCGYIIYNECRNKSLSMITSYLDENNIWSIGRYGSWEYSNMEDALIHGKRIAEKLKNLN